MEGILTFGIGVTTCIIIAGMLYLIVTIKRINESVESLDNDIEDIQSRVFTLERDLSNKIDNITNQIDEIKTDMDGTYDGLIDEVDEMIDEVYEEAGVELEKRFKSIETYINESLSEASDSID